MTHVIGTLIEFILFDLIGRLPIGIRRAMGASCGYLLSLIPTRERRVAELQLARCRIPGSHALIIKKMYQGIGISFFESLNLTPLFKAPAKVQCPTFDSLRPLIQDQRGLVALTAHTGNWDLHGAYFVRQDIPVFTIGREARNHIAQHVLAKLRLKCGIQTIWRYNNAHGLKEIIKVLQGGNVLASLIDQDTVVSSILVPFFGIPAKTPSSLIGLAKRWNCHLVTSFIIRNPDGSYTIHAEQIPQELSEEEILVLYHERLECLLRKHPEQWVWFHKRWRSATGKTLGTDAYCDYLQHGTFQS